MSQKLHAEMHATIRYKSARNDQRLQVGEIKTEENKIEVRLEQLVNKITELTASSLTKIQQAPRKNN